VPAADPAMPQPSPRTNHALSRALSVNALTEMTSGVRVSCSPRSTPVPASTSSMAGTPNRLTRR